MIAKITKIERSTHSEKPQIDVHVEYEDSRFPATHQHPEGGKRLQIFTCPPEKFSNLEKTVIEELVLAGAEQLELNMPEEMKSAPKKELTTKDIQDKEMKLQSFVNLEVDTKVKAK